MDKIRVIIADDEPLSRRGVRQMLARRRDVDIVAEARNGRETVRLLRELKPDLLFLDVQMPELDGFGVLREIGAKSISAVIFVTAHDEFAVRAFEAHALDYLVKPLEEARFAEALERMRERLRSAQAIDLSRKLSALLARHEQERAKQRILVPIRRRASIWLGTDQVRFDPRVLADACVRQCDDGADGGHPNICLRSFRRIHRPPNTRDMWQKVFAWFDEFFEVSKEKPASQR